MGIVLGVGGEKGREEERERESYLTLGSFADARKTRPHCYLAGNMPLKPKVAIEGQEDKGGGREFPARPAVLSVLFWGQFISVLSCPKLYGPEP